MEVSVGSKQQAGTAPRGIGRLRHLAALWPRGVWLMALYNLTLWTGRGMVTPFMVIYFAQIVGLPASLVGSGIAATSLAGIGFVMLTAAQIDRRGGRPVLVACLAGVALATAAFPLGTSPLAFLAVVTLLNLAGQLYWPASDATISSVAPRDRVAEAMSLARVAQAVGIGLGGLTGGVLVNGGGMSEYRLLCLLSGGLIGLAALLVWRLVPHVPVSATAADGQPGSWRDLLPDRELRVALVAFFLLIFGFSQVQMTVPPFLRAEAGISEGAIGSLFTLNTILVVCLQIAVTARVARRDTGQVLVVAALFWAGACAIMLATPALGLAAAVAAMLAFTAGELLFIPASAIIPVRLAPLHLRGRYFALLSVIWGGSWAVASLAAGFALDSPLPAIIWPAVAVVLAGGAVVALRLRGASRLAPVTSAVTNAAPGTAGDGVASQGTTSHAS